MISNGELALLVVGGLFFVTGIVGYWVYAWRMVKESPKNSQNHIYKKD